MIECMLICKSCLSFISESIIHELYYCFLSMKLIIMYMYCMLLLCSVIIEQTLFLSPYIGLCSISFVLYRT